MGTTTIELDLADVADQTTRNMVHAMASALLFEAGCTHDGISSSGDVEKVLRIENPSIDPSSILTKQALVDAWQTTHKPQVEAATAARLVAETGAAEVMVDEKEIGRACDDVEAECLAIKDGDFAALRAFTARWAKRARAVEIRRGEL